MSDKIHPTHFHVSKEMPWKNLPRVSILIPYFGNRLEQWKRTYYMLRDQTYKGLIELWVISDGDNDLDWYDSFPSSNMIVHYWPLRMKGNWRSPNMALLYAYNQCDGDYIIISSPEILVPYNAVEVMVTQGDRNRRNVPILYKLSRKQQRLIDTVNWKADLSNLQILPQFPYEEMWPGGYMNMEAGQHRTHGGFVGQSREAWERYDPFLHASEEEFETDSYWHRREIEMGIPALPLDLEVYHQWHERKDAPKKSARIQRIEERE